MKIYFFILIILVFFTGCKTITNIEGILDTKVNNAQSESIPIFLMNDDNVIWEYGTYVNKSIIQPRNFAENRSLYVYDIIIESPGSLIIGGIDNETGEPFATLSGLEIPIPTVNTTRIAVILDRDLLVDSAYEGTKFMSNLNRDFNPNSSAIVSSSDPLGNGHVIQKFNQYYYEPYLNVHSSAFGQMEHLITSDNDFNASTQGSNAHKFGFYDYLILREDTSLLDYIGKDFVFEINKTTIKMNKEAIVEDTLYFNHTYNFTPKTSPNNKSNKVALFARDDDKMYIKKSNGQVRALIEGGIGSIILFDKLHLNNHSQIHGNMQFNNSIYKGNSTAYACFDLNGCLFRSYTRCEDLSANYTCPTANLTGLDIGEEI